MSSTIATSGNQANHDIEKRAIGIAFAIGCVALLYGLVTAAEAYMVSGAILYSGSLIATAIRDRASA